MSKMYFFLLILISLQSFGGTFGFKEGKLEAFSEVSFLTTNKNYDDNGVLYQLNPPNQLSEMALELGGRYDFSSPWGARVAGRFKQLSARSLTYNNSVSGISDITVGSDFLVYDNEIIKVIPDVSLFIPLSDVPIYGVPFMNDGAFAVRGLISVASRVWVASTSVYGGYLWRGQGLSSQIPLGALARFNLGKSFFANVEAFGEISMADDRYTNSVSTRHLLIASSNGGSFLYNSVNPSFFAAKASVGWNISKVFNVAVGLRQTFIGYKVADETRFFVNLSFSPAEKKRRRSFYSQPRRHMEEDDFQVDTGGE